MKTFSLLSRFLLMLVTVVLLTGCQEEATKPNETPRMFVRLENQTEHSGIMVKILELNIWTITDSQGYFQFDTLQNGNYTFQARYPYFKTEKFSIMVNNGEIQPFINLHLKQLLQFWIEPAETTIFIYNDSCSNVLLNGFKQFRTNNSDVAIKLSNSSSPIESWAIVSPKEKELNIFSLDSTIHECIYHKRLITGDLAMPMSYTLFPSDTTSVRMFDFSIPKKCFCEENYEIYSSITDESNFPEYFRGYLLFDKSNPSQKLFDKMNRSLLLKQKLFRPCKVIIKKR